MNFTIGTDSEVFVTKNQQIISGIGLLKASKDRPKKMKTHLGVFELSEDNILFEFATPVCNNIEQFKSCSMLGVEILKEKAKSFGEEYDILIKGSADVNPKELKSKKSLVFGCEPDFNIYLMDNTPIPNAETTIRAAGGHIHIGLDMDNIDGEYIINFVKALDLHLAMYFLPIENDNLRRTLYGKAGSIREKIYGIEYRTLSNIWLTKEEYIEKVYNTVDFILSQMYNKDFIASIQNYDEDEIQNIINTNDVKSSVDVLQEINQLKLAV